jgi:hypothetical protein
MNDTTREELIGYAFALNEIIVSLDANYDTLSALQADILEQELPKNRESRAEAETARDEVLRRLDLLDEAA